MGKPGRSHVLSLQAEGLRAEVGLREVSGGTESSKYPEEEKAISDSLSSGERTGKSPNRGHVVGPSRYGHGVVGAGGSSWEGQEVINSHVS